MRRLIGPGLAILLLAVPVLAGTDYRLHIANMVGIYVLLALGMNLAMGYCGMLNLAIGGLYGVGAYTAALLTMKLHLPFLAAVAAGGVLAALVGAALGLPSLRVRSHYLAMVTMGLGEVLHMLFLNWTSVTRGAEGMPGIPIPEVFGFALASEARWWYLILAVAVLFYLLARLLVNSHIGRAMVAVRDDYIAAKAVGVNIAYYQVLSFALSGLFAGVAGGLYAHLVGFVSPDTFAIQQTLFVLSMSLVGGLGHLGGSLFGAAALTVANEWLRAFEEYQLVIYGAIILLMVLFAPGGMWSLGRRFVAWRGRRAAVHAERRAAA